jgi:hypothetical protein
LLALDPTTRKRFNDFLTNEALDNSPTARANSRTGGGVRRFIRKNS